MIARLAVAAMLSALALAAAAQDRPPSPADDATSRPIPDSAPPPGRPAAAPAAAPVGDADAADMSSSQRPPEKPAHDADPAPPDAVGGTADTGTDTAAPQSARFGPPAPPRWWALQEPETDHAACRLALSFLGTTYQEEAPVLDPDDRDCGMARPLRVTEIIPGIQLEGGALMRCDTARSLGFWARDFLRPAAATLPGAPRVTGLRLGTTYDCRARIGTGSDAPDLSEHALGTAIDIAAVLLDKGDPVAIAPRAGTGDRIEGFQRAIRGAACLYFTTVLGPGSNAAHDDHLHLDMADRRAGWRLCE